MLLNKLFIILLLSSLNSIHLSYGYPNYLTSCNDINTSTPGGAFNHMGISNHSPSTTACTISISGGLSTFVPCQQYTLTVTSTSNWAHALSVDNGQITTKAVDIGSETKCGAKVDVSTSSTYTFIAPPSGTVQVSAVCGNHGVMNAATKLNLTKNPSSPSRPNCNPTNAPTKTPTKTPSKSPTQTPTDINTPTKTPTPPTNNPTKAPTPPTNNPTISPTRSPTPPTNAPTKSPTKSPTSPTNNPTKLPTKAPVAGFKSLENLSTSLISVEFQPSSEKVNFVLQNKNKGWIGIGLASSSGGMAGGKAVIGMDSSKNSGYSDVQLYDLVKKSKSDVTPVGTVAELETVYGIVNASFTTEASATVLKFTIIVGKQNSNFKLVNKDAPPTIIYAIGGSTFDVHSDRGSLAAVNFASTETSNNAQAYKVSNTLALHVAAMIIAYCILFPFGVSMPLFNNKKYGGQKLCGCAGSTWFMAHKVIQSLALILAIIGFASIVYFVQSSGGIHFNDNHKRLGLAVFVGSIVNPIYGFLRPHKPEAGDAKTCSRFIFEWLHPIIGYIILFAGAINCFLGVLLFTGVAGSSTYEYAGRVGATGLTGSMGLGVIVLIAIFMGTVVFGLLLRILGRFLCSYSEDDNKPILGGEIAHRHV